MKTFLLVVLTVAALFIWQRKSGGRAVETRPHESAALEASPARTISEHNWAKNSLDRARDVADQMQSARAEDQQP